MMHPFRESAIILRAAANLELKYGGKWADLDRVSRLRAEARELERYARADTEWKEPSHDV